MSEEGSVEEKDGVKRGGGGVLRERFGDRCDGEAGAG